MAFEGILTSGNTASSDKWIIPFYSEPMEIDPKELPADTIQCPNALTRKLLGRREAPVADVEPEGGIPVEEFLTRLQHVVHEMIMKRLKGAEDEVNRVFNLSYVREQLQAQAIQSLTSEVHFLRTEVEDLVTTNLTEMEWEPTRQVLPFDPIETIRAGIRDGSIILKEVRETSVAPAGPARHGTPVRGQGGVGMSRASSRQSTPEYRSRAAKVDKGKRRMYPSRQENTPTMSQPTGNGGQQGGPSGTQQPTGDGGQGGEPPKSQGGAAAGAGDPDDDGDDDGDDSDPEPPRGHMPSWRAWVKRRALKQARSEVARNDMAPPRLPYECEGKVDKIDKYDGKNVNDLERFLRELRAKFELEPFTYNTGRKQILFASTRLGGKASDSFKSYELRINKEQSIHTTGSWVYDPRYEKFEFFTAALRDSMGSREDRKKYEEEWHTLRMKGDKCQPQVLMKLV